MTKILAFFIHPIFSLVLFTATVTGCLNMPRPWSETL